MTEPAPRKKARAVITSVLGVVCPPGTPPGKTQPRSCRFDVSRSPSPLVEGGIVFTTRKGGLEYTVEDFEEFYQLARAADVVYTDGAYFPHAIPDMGRAGRRYGATPPRRSGCPYVGPLVPYGAPFPQAFGTAEWAALHAETQVISRPTRVVSDYKTLVDTCAAAKTRRVVSRSHGQRRSCQVHIWQRGFEGLSPRWT
jgi:hypothetical protein